LLKEAYEFAQNVSNNIPSYDINKMEFGAYKEDSFVCLFADMRHSTDRAIEIGAIDTFLTIHAIMPAMIYVVEAYGGSIVDLPGDGVMALFKGNPKGIQWSDNKLLNEESLAVRCGEVILTSFHEVVNPILLNDGIPPVIFGVGVDTGKVIVTKVGTDNIRDLKAIGECINGASKNSFGESELFISIDAYTNVTDNLKLNFKKTLRPKSNVEGYLRKIY